ncbi:restriction endonuclease [Arcicella rigui]|uniref:Restriction endonuclease n=1 Tax=Arcicella rigui TaxID=797020 RepID=A0ABU5QBQ2_9BACT|nr:restriction endonuclease [Arcicella rigui]MEA5140284.1 restriction endonuclease [Arcicella rigui]
MPTTEEYIRKIQLEDRSGLIRLWNQIIAKDTPDWEKGKAFEFLILRAFELEGAIVKWPYSVAIYGQVVEQIDGAIHFQDSNISILIECKDYNNNLSIEPIAKLRNQLLRRPANTIGSVFSTTGFTEPALILSQFSAPQTILLWEKDHIEFCLKNGNFKEGFLKKYRHAIEDAFPNFDVTI